MKILQHLPRISYRRRLARAFTTLLGLLLTLTGVIAGAPVLLVCIAVVLVLLKGSIPSDLGDGGGLFFITSAITSAVCLWSGRRLIRGKRRLALFLRRFGFQDASKALTFAVSSAFGRRWRLVTLDDAAIAPLGVSMGKRRMAQFGRWLFLMILIVAAIYVVMWFFGDEPDRIIKTIFDDMLNSSRGRGDNLLAAFFGAIVGTFMVGMIILSLSLAIMLLGVSLSASATLFSWNTWRQVRKAEQSKALALTDPTRIESTLAKVAKRTKGIFAARLTVLRVSGAIWQEVVRKLSISADAIVVDISEPSVNLLWEIETLKARQDIRCVYVGEFGKVNGLSKTRSPGEDRNEAAARLTDLLENDDVIAYHSGQKSAMRQFAGDLAAYLDPNVA
ncbi:MAG: hypothetical protein P8X96_19900 [Desulfobacteraceae bacterium]